MPVKVAFQLGYLLWHADGLLGGTYKQLKVRLEQFKKLPFLATSCVKCSKCASCVLTNLMLNMCFCYVNHQLWACRFILPPML